jgi:hypothetical protein
MLTRIDQSVDWVTRTSRSGTAILVVLVAMAGPAHATAISAPFVSVGVGDSFTIDIAIDDSINLTSWQFDLAFDVAVARADGVAEGPFMSSFGATLFVPGFIDNLNGLISLTSAFYVDVPPNPAGDGVVARIEVQALALGVSPLAFSNVFLNALDQGFEISPGQITVLGAGGGDDDPHSVPEPTTLLLVSTGVVLAFRRPRSERKGSSSPSRAIGPRAAVVGGVILGLLATGGPAAARIIPPVVEPPTTAGLRQASPGGSAGTARCCVCAVAMLPSSETGRVNSWAFQEVLS